MKRITHRFGKHTPEGQENHNHSEMIIRGTAVVNNICCMGFAWCLFYGAKWMLASYNWTQEETLLRVALALLVSFTSFILIFFLDCLADSDATDDTVDEAIKQIIEGLGILVGFSWEQSFDQAVGSIVSTVNYFPPAVSKLIMAFVLCIIVIPAWRWYVLPTVQRMEEEEEGSEGEGGEEKKENGEEKKENGEAKTHGGYRPPQLTESA